MGDALNIRNRVIGLQYFKTVDLCPNKRNWRKHPAKQSEALKGILAEVGIAGALLAYKSPRNDGALTLIDGHLRSELGNGAEWPVLVLDLTDAEADLLLASYDPLSAMAQPDPEILGSLLKDVQTASEGLGQMLSELAEEAGILSPDQSDVDAEPQIDKAEQLRAKWKTEAGQLWAMGEHRLLCGDSTKAEDVARVMGGGRAGFCFTDPPYGVRYSGRGRSTGEQEIENDDLDPDSLRAFLADAFRLMPLAPGSNVFVCHADQKPGIRPAFEGAVADAGLRMLGTVIWSKNAGSMGWQDFRAQHEPILFACTEGEGRLRVEDRTATTIWQIDREPPGGYLHPTTKPVELVMRAMGYCCPSGAVVYEPFSGSGTTILACEQLGRKCRAIEISPAYVAVTLQRYLDATGKKPELCNAR